MAYTSPASALAIDSKLAMYETPFDPIATVLVLRFYGAAVSPVNLAGFQGHWTFLPGSPATPPQNRPRTLGIAGEPLEGSVTLAVADTGLLHDLVNAETDLEREFQVELPFARTSFTENSDLELDGEYGPNLAGHGTFITSLIHQVHPDANVINAKVHRVPSTWFSTPEGSEVQASVAVSDELQVLEAIERLIGDADTRGVSVDALNLSLGVVACPMLTDAKVLAEYLVQNEADFDGAEEAAGEPGLADRVADDPDLLNTLIGAVEEATLTLSITIETWNSTIGSPVYASAGNHLDTLTFYPANFGDVRSVAATGTHSACFTAASTIDAPGADLIGLGSLQNEPSYVVWSGTSFASPIAMAIDAGGDLSAVKIEERTPQINGC